MQEDSTLPPDLAARDRSPETLIELLVSGAGDTDHAVRLLVRILSRMAPGGAVLLIRETAPHAGSFFDEVFNRLAEHPGEGLRCHDEDWLQSWGIHGLVAVAVPGSASGIRWALVWMTLETGESAPTLPSLGYLHLGAAMAGLIEDINRRDRLMVDLQNSVSLGLMARGFAHDMNNLLGLIVNQVSFLKPKLSGDRQACEDVDAVMRHAFHAAELNRELVDFIRSRSLAWETGSLLDLVRTVFPLLRTGLRRTVELELHGQGDDHAVRMVPTRIRQAVINLVFNAAQAMNHRGRIRLTVRPAQLGEGPISLMESGRRYQVLAVEDNGPGVPPELREAILGEFFTSKEGEGTGIGLSIVQHIARDHSGWLEVGNSELGGACFRLGLAVCPPAAGSTP